MGRPRLPPRGRRRQPERRETPRCDRTDSAARRPEVSAPSMLALSRWSPQTVMPAGVRTGRCAGSSAEGGSAGSASCTTSARRSRQPSTAAPNQARQLGADPRLELGRIARASRAPRPTPAPFPGGRTRGRPRSSPPRRSRVHAPRRRAAATGRAPAARSAAKENVVTPTMCGAVKAGTSRAAVTPSVATTTAAASMRPPDSSSTACGCTRATGMPRPEHTVGESAGQLGGDLLHPQRRDRRLAVGDHPDDELELPARGGQLVLAEHRREKRTEEGVHELLAELETAEPVVGGLVAGGRTAPRRTPSPPGRAGGPHAACPRRSRAARRGSSRIERSPERVDERVERSRRGTPAPRERSVAAGESRGRAPAGPRDTR